MKIVTLARLNRANTAVKNELQKWGFYDAPMRKIDVYLVPLGFAYGWQCYGKKGGGEICIPSCSWSKLTDLMTGEFTALRDVLRHEYAHAIADTHRGLVRSQKFKDAFGALHTWGFSWEYDPDFHVTRYSASSPAEDFAEVFMKFHKHGGTIPAKYNTAGIQRKWKFILKLSRAISTGRRRWG